MRPGEEIWREQKPLLFCSKERLYEYTRSDKQIKLPFLAYFMYTNFLTPQEKQRFRKLISPCPKFHSDQFQKIFERISYPCSPSLDHREQERKTFVDVCNVVRLHGVEIEDKIAVYEYRSKAAHSCFPNCIEEFQGDLIICRAALPIKSGERITVCSELNIGEATHQRRKQCLERKDFTCHCARCDAEADDTREFDCFDPQCPGSCFACQPINMEPLVSPDMIYTGVEYVEPHLLACTVCHRKPPLKYQQDMLALEPSWSDFQQQANSMHKRVAPAQFAQRLKAFKVPRNHIRSLAVAVQKIDAARIYTKVEGMCFEYVETTAQEYVRLIAHVSNYIPGSCGHVYWEVTDGLLRCKQHSPLTLQIARDCAKKAVRCQLLRRGRETRDSSFDTTLLTVLQCLPPPPATLDYCMFCGESPLRAAITLSRCGRCKQVTYCSAGCQKAHWLLHKKSCCKK